VLTVFLALFMAPLSINHERIGGLNLPNYLSLPHLPPQSRFPMRGYVQRRLWSTVFLCVVYALMKAGKAGRIQFTTMAGEL